MKTLHTLIIATALGCALATAAFAHGDEAHSAETGVVKKEQKDWGIAGDAKKVKRVVKISMLDTMRFSPDKINVKQGETIKFVIKNTGAMLHEFVIGTSKENAEHAALMLKFPDMEHSEPYMAHVPPGKTGEIIWTFNKPGDFDFACLIAGHYQAGMRGTIRVAAFGKTAPSAAMAAPASPAATTPAAAPTPAAKPAKDTPTTPQASSKAMAAAEMAEAEVRKIDLDAKKITLRHGPIKNLDMPGMTMVFQVRNPALLSNLAVGDKIMFTAEQLQGALVMTNAEKQGGSK
jgi:uncharacterized cupredoxin-like copper-binding protein/Cu/Ag efflux protein CusF